MTLIKIRCLYFKSVEVVMSLSSNQSNDTKSKSTLVWGWQGYNYKTCQIVKGSVIIKGSLISIRIQVFDWNIFNRQIIKKFFADSKFPCAANTNVTPSQEIQCKIGCWNQNSKFFPEKATFNARHFVQPCNTNLVLSFNIFSPLKEAISRENF